MNFPINNYYINSARNVYCSNSNLDNLIIITDDKYNKSKFYPLFFAL